MNDEPMGQGVVAAGHPATADAAAGVLAEGGNAFDAVVAGVLAACVAEPMLVSLGGGGFLLARPADGPPRLYDFFAQTPRVANRGRLDFSAIQGDFGGTQQEFHIGMASIATPGLVKGLFRIQRDLGHLPMTVLAQPAVSLAREGVTVGAIGAYARQVLDPIVTATETSRRLFAGSAADGRALEEGARFTIPELADALEAFAHHGESLMYRGDWAATLATACREGGGHLSRDDLAGYRVVVRKPLVGRFRAARLLLNPAPSLGGSLIAFALDLLRAAQLSVGDVVRTQGADRALGANRVATRLAALVRAMSVTDEARRDQRVDARAAAGAKRLFGARAHARYRRAVRQGLATSRGTTHISVIDGDNNAASLSVSNGEGCGWVLPDTGIMLNNMLGEADLAPDGFHRWPTNRRLASMMSPTVVEHDDGRTIALGTGGSNRIRSAITQVLIGLLDDGLSPREAVDRPRLHVENGRLDVEPGIDELIAQTLGAHVGSLHRWPRANMFFGGVHVAERDVSTGHCRGAGDPRRGGVSRLV